MISAKPGCKQLRHVSARPCSNAPAGVQRSHALKCGVGLAPYITLGPMEERLFIALFAVLFCMVLVWFALVALLFAALRARHSPTYMALGRSSLFANTVNTSFQLLRFLLQRNYRGLNDPPLQRLCNFMVAFLFAYVVLFFGALVLFAVQPAKPG